MKYPKWVQDQIELAIKDGDLPIDDAEAIKEFAEYCLRTGPVNPNQRVVLTPYGQRVAQKLQKKKLGWA